MNEIKRQQKLNKLLQEVPSEIKYWDGLEDQREYLKATESFSYKWFGISNNPILYKYKGLGIPPIYPNYKNIGKDFPEIAKLIKL